MKVKIKRATFVAGTYVPKDKTVDVSDKDAKLLIATDKAENPEKKAEAKSK